MINTLTYKIVKMKIAEMGFQLARLALYIVIFSIIFYTACGSSNEPIKQEAEAYCEIYNIETWDFSKYSDAWALQNELI